MLKATESIRREEARRKRIEVLDQKLDQIGQSIFLNHYSKDLICDYLSEQGIEDDIVEMVLKERASMLNDDSCSEETT